MAAPWNMNPHRVQCEICGVSFNINRIRRADEPFTAAWQWSSSLPSRYNYEDSLKNDGRGLFVSSPYDKKDQCPPEAACANVRRLYDRLEDYDFGEENRHWPQEGSDCSGDLDHELVDSEENETLEYQSDDGSLHDDETNGLNSQTQEMEVKEQDSYSICKGSESSGADNAALHGTVRPCNGQECFNLDLEALHPWQVSRYDPIYEHASNNTRTVIYTEVLPVVNAGDSFREDFWRTRQKLEHVAGPGCKNPGGYSGHEVSVEEIKGCTTFQFLIRKSEDWHPDRDDQDFENESDFYLTGLSDNYDPHREPQVLPNRHDTKDLNPSQSLYEYSEYIEKYMIFHPTCFEIFTRASRTRFGYLDIHGLTARREHSGWELPHHPAVLDGSHGEDGWLHRSGDAWLVANPVLVPKLPTFLDSILPDVDKGCDSNHDPFSKLPKELVDIIFDFLAPVDVASLRLAGCVQYLPLSHWRDVFIKDMPWVWEMWDEDTKSSFWATTSYDTIKAEKERRDYIAGELTELQALHETVIKEDMPEIWGEHKKDHAWLEVKPSSIIDAPYINSSGASENDFIPSLKRGKANYCNAFYQIAKRGDEFKGLRNRKRIWQAAEEIIARIIKHREQGEIVG